MSNEERELFELTGEVWNRFHALPELHPSDRHEFMTHVHALQNMILAREAYRQYKAKNEHLIINKE